MLNPCHLYNKFNINFYFLDIQTTINLTKTNFDVKQEKSKFESETRVKGYFQSHNEHMLM